MPWIIERRDGKHCVVKKGASRPVPGGCHDSRADAIKHQRALYASERKNGGGMSEATVSLTGQIDGHEFVVVDEHGEELARGPLSEYANAMPWEGPLGLEGYATADGRYLIPGEVSMRALPLPLNVQMMTDEGHKNSVNAGAITKIEHIPITEFARRDEFNLADVPDTATVIWGEGFFDDSEASVEAQRMIANGYGVSLDLPPDRHGLFDRATYEELDAGTLELEDIIAGKYLHGVGGKIAGATIVNVPAFEHAVIQMSDGTALVASAMPLKIIAKPARGAAEAAEMMTALVEAGRPVREHLNALLAGNGVVTKGGLIATPKLDYQPLVAAATIRKPPRDWLEDPRLSGPTPLTYTAEGRIYGHLAPWNGCHTGYGGVCIPPPRSPSNYALFNVGLVEADNGDMVPCGKLMFCREGGKHADVYLNAQQAAKHYDDATRVAGYVRAGSDRHGTWLAGFLKSDLTDDDIAFLRLHPPSGDWRPVGGSEKELVAAFSVPVPGFPIPHAMVASAGEDVTAIILGPWAPEALSPREFRRRKHALSLRRR